MVALSKVFVIVLASYDQEVYKHMIRLRRIQFQRRNIPHLFVLDGPMPEKLESDEVYFKRTPEMEGTAGPKLEKRFAGLLRKFQAAAKGFLTDSNYDQFTHVLRINVSTFINFDRFEQLLATAPDRGCYAGTWLFQAENQPTPKFLSGTAILFSRDVLEFLTSLNLDEHAIAREEVDDIALGGLLVPQNFQPLDHFPMIIVPEEGWERVPEHPFIRVRNEGCNRDAEDRGHWLKLMHLFENYDEPETFTDANEDGRHWFWIFLSLALLLVFLNGRKGRR